MLYLFVHFIKPVPDRTEVESLDLHMTLVHWFEADAEPSEVVSACKAVLIDTRPFAVQVAGEDMFGPNQDTPVNRVARSDELFALHNQLIRSLTSVGARDTEPRWSGDGWNPHVTHKKTGRLYEGDSLMVDSVTLISAKTLGGSRAIEKTLRLE